MAAFYTPASGNPRFLAFLGDSNLWIGGEDCSRDVSWTHYVTEALAPDTVINYSRSGATWTCGAETRADAEHYSEILHPLNVVANQLLRLATDVKNGTLPPPDMIMIGAGTNDAWFAPQLPGIFSDDPDTSLQGSVINVTETIYTIWPGCRVVVVTPPPADRFPRERLTFVSDIIEESSVGGNVLVIRMDMDELFEPEAEGGYTKDGVHTTAKGAKRIADVIMDRLNRS